ncbi:MAG: hypothetical protein E4H28_03380 [Gemmatimonadales bacterium]|nr:MAG: hypothetical protein E4H28_03380 [Gemmatimonadales bacterium]
MNARDHGKPGRIAGPVLAMLAGFAIAGCGDDPAGPGRGGDTTRPPTGLIILVPDAGAPPLATSDTSFVATKGVRSEVLLRYAPVPPDDTGDQFLELRIEDQSLLRYPIGHPRAGALFVDGDTVTISISIDPATLSATLLPSGLQFDPLNPAELELRYQNADPDFDGDGDDDPDLEDDIDLWRQENPGDPWERVGTLQDFSLDRVRADLTEFSRYALGI